MRVEGSDRLVVIELEWHEADELSESLVSACGTGWPEAGDAVRSLSHELIQALYSEPKKFNFNDWGSG